MRFKSQLRRKKAAAALAADLTNLGPIVAEALGPRMAAVLEEGEEMPDVAHLLDVLGRMVRHESEALEAVDRERSQEGSAANRARRELRGRAEPELRQRVIWVREQMRNAYGAKEANRMLRHQGRTPRGLDDLQIMAENMVAFLPIAEPPKPRPGSKPKPAAWAEYLRPALTDFSRLMKGLRKHVGGRQDAVELRKEALALFDRSYSRFVRLAKIFTQLAGLESLAEHLRHHPGRPAEQIAPL